MTPTTELVGTLMVALGAGVGAPLRYVIDQAVESRHDMVMPWHGRR
jgi:CrcB protein